MKSFNYIENENLIRRYWLKSFKIYSIFFFIYYSVNLVAAYYNDTITNHTNASLTSAFGIPFFVLTLLSLMLASHYYFGYKKKGTYLLAWVSFFGGLKTISSTLTSLADIKTNFNEFGFVNPIINFYYILEISAIGLAAYYIYSCWLLYSVNAELKKQKKIL